MITKEQWSSLVKKVSEERCKDTTDKVCYCVCGCEYEVIEANYVRNFIVLKNFELLTFDRVVRKRGFMGLNEAQGSFLVYPLPKTLNECSL